MELKLTNLFSYLDSKLFRSYFLNALLCPDFSTKLRKQELTFAFSLYQINII